MPAKLMRAVFYRAPDGSEPVAEFITALRPISCQVVLENQINLLNRLTTIDPPLAFPHSSQVDGELRELRCHCGKDLYRILYRRSKNLFILLHIFRKNTKSTPADEKAIAVDRWDDFRVRMDAQPRTPPRPSSQRHTDPRR